MAESILSPPSSLDGLIERSPLILCIPRCSNHWWRRLRDRPQPSKYRLRAEYGPVEQVPGGL